MFIKYIYLFAVSFVSLSFVACGKISPQVLQPTISTPTVGKQSIIQVKPDNDYEEDPIIRIKEEDSTVENPFPTLVKYEDFQFGEYMLLTAQIKARYGIEGGTIYSFSLLGEGIQTFEAGKSKYNLLNQCYAKEYPKSDKWHDELEEGYRHTDSKFFSDLESYIFDRRIEKISRDGTRVLCSSNIKNSKGEIQWSFPNLFEVFEGDELLYSYHSLSEITPLDSLAGGFTDYFLYKDNTVKYINFDNLSEITMDNGFCPSTYLINESQDKYLTFENNIYGNQFNLYSLKNGRGIAHDFSWANALDVSIRQFTQNNNIVYTKNFSKNDYGSLMDTFIISYNGTNKKYLGSFMINQILSPDEKYLAFNLPLTEDFYMFCDYFLGGIDEKQEKAIYELYSHLSKFPSGVYIKNLETGDVFCYPSDQSDIQLIGWSKKEGIDKLIGEERNN